MYIPIKELIQAYSYYPQILSKVFSEDSNFDPYKRNPTPSDWAPVEIICHLRDCEKVALERTLSIKNNNNPLLEGFDQEAWAIEKGYIKSDFKQVFQVFIELRKQHINILIELDNREWNMIGQHTEIGKISIYNHIVRMLAHDFIHAEQIIRSIS